MVVRLAVPLFGHVAAEASAEVPRPAARCCRTHTRAGQPNHAASTDRLIKASSYDCLRRGRPPMRPRAAGWRGLAEVRPCCPATRHARQRAGQSRAGIRNLSPAATLSPRDRKPHRSRTRRIHRGPKHLPAALVHTTASGSRPR